MHDVDRPADEPLPRIPGYEILLVLGQGGMGIVYKAVQIGLDRVVALKMIRDGAHAAPDQLERFRIEAEVVARVDHPGIVRVYDVGEHIDPSSGEVQPFLALEFVDGGTLAGHLDGRARPAREAASLIAELARAVQHAHEHGVVHRDLKPANVLLGTDGVLKITDFGLARLLDANSQVTADGTVLGTPAYMAPEQASGQPGQAGAAADVYALGAILYECLTGRPPFQGETPMDTLVQVMSAEVVPPRLVMGRVPRDLETICLKCLAKDPGRRYASARDLADDLDRYLRGEPILARRTERPVTLLVLLALLAGVVGLAVLLNFVPNIRGRPTPPVAGNPNPNLNPSAVVDLLGLVDLRRDAVRGEWKLDNKTLLSPEMLPAQGTFAWLQLPCLPPEEYDLAMVVERRGVKDGLAVGLLIGGRQTWLRLDHGGATSGIDGIRGTRVTSANNPTRKVGPVLPRGVPVPVECRVRKGGILVRAGGVTVVDWTGSPALLGFHDGTSMNRQCLFLGSTSAFAVRDLTLRPVTGEPVLLPATGADDPDRTAALTALWWGNRSTVRILQDEKESDIASLALLPTAPFQLRGITLGRGSPAERILGALPAIAGLATLDVTCLEVTDADATSLARQVDLTEIRVAGTALTDAALAHLSRLPKLALLQCGEGQFSATALQTFATERPGCEVRNLGSDRVAAEMVLATTGGVEDGMVYGDVDIRKLSGQTVKIYPTGRLPEEDFRLTVAGFPQLIAIPAWRHRSLHDLPDLEHISAWGNSTTDEGVLYWKDLPKLRIVKLAYAVITLQAIRHLVQFKTIDQLEIPGTRCEDEWLRELRQLVDLGHLAIQNTRVTSAGLAHLTGLQKLRKLELDGTLGITDAAVEHLSKMSSLTELSLKGTSITPAGLGQLRRDLPQCKITN